MKNRTPTHLKNKSIVEYYVINDEIKTKTTTHYFCGKARNMTISAGAFHQVTCKKCLEAAQNKMNGDK